MDLWGFTLQVEEINWKDIFRAIKHPAFILNTSHEILAANNAFLKKVDLAEDDVIGKKCYRLTNCNNCGDEIPTCPMENMLNQGVEETFELEMEAFNGYAIVSCTPVYDENGELDKIIHISTDITPMKKAEEALKISERKYRELVDNAMVAIFTTNMAGDILFANDEMVKMFKYDSFEDLKRHNIVDVYRNSNDRKIFLNNLLEQGVFTDYEVETVDKNGETVYVLVGASIHNGLISGMFMNINDRKISETKLKESEERYRTLYSSMNEGVAIHKIVYKDKKPVDYTIIDVNPSYEDILGLSRDNIVGKYATDVYDSDEAPYLDIYSSVAQTGISKQFDTYFKPMDKYFHVSVFSPSKNTFVTVFEDVSSRRKSEIEIKASLKEKEVLLQEIHHRVKNNMQIISSLLNLQTRYVDGDEIAMDVLKESQNRVTSMAMIHEKLYQSEDFRHINIADYLDKLVRDLLYSYAIPKGQIKTLIESDDIKLNIETSIPCGLIINECVSNSLKYAFPEGRTGEIAISLKQFDDQLVLEISDDGIGFPKEIDFKNTDSLGLQLVNSLVEQIDGTIERDDSNGTKFTIKFQELIYKRRI
jgi:PAS domain S-box-containing protein